MAFTLPEPFASIPKENFLFGPSPIQELPRIAAALGGKVGVYAKREVRSPSNNSPTSNSPSFNPSIKQDADKLLGLQLRIGQRRQQGPKA